MKKELKNTKKKNNKGFSLVELIVVIAIMAVLMAVLAPAMLRYVEKSRIQKDKSAVSEAANAAELALGDDTIYEKAVATGNKITVTIADGKAASTSPTELQTDINNTVGTIKFASKRYEGQTATIEFEYNADRSAYVLTKEEISCTGGPDNLLKETKKTGSTTGDK